MYHSCQYPKSPAKNLGFSLEDPKEIMIPFAPNDFKIFLCTFWYLYNFSAIPLAVWYVAYVPRAK